MKTLVSLTTLATVMAPVSALAHPGGHAHVEGGLLAHMLQSPFHLAVVALGLGFAVYGVVGTLRSAKAELRRKSRDS